MPKEAAITNYIFSRISVLSFVSGLSIECEMTQERIHTAPAARKTGTIQRVTIILLLGFGTLAACSRTDQMPLGRLIGHHAQPQRERVIFADADQTAILPG